MKSVNFFLLFVIPHFFAIRYNGNAKKNQITNMAIKANNNNKPTMTFFIIKMKILCTTYAIKSVLFYLPLSSFLLFMFFSVSIDILREVL